MAHAAALQVPTTTPGARVVVILGGLAALGPLSFDMYLPAFPELRETFGASASGVQLTLMAGLLGLGLGQLVAGATSDALGLAGMSGGAVALLAVVAAGAGLAWALGALFVSVACVGLVTPADDGFHPIACEETWSPERLRALRSELSA